MAVRVLNAPIIATAVTSFKSDAEIAANPSLAIQAPTWANYRGLFAMADRYDLLAYLGNSLAAASIGTALAVALSLTAACAIARIGTGRGWLLLAVVNLRAIPLIVFSIPIYLMY